MRYRPAAWQSEDGTEFDEKSDCERYEKLAAFNNWYIRHLPLGLMLPTGKDMLEWLINNAEDIRGFLPPVAAKPELPNDVLSVNQRLAAKPELDIEVLREYGKYYASGDLLVNIKQIEKWLAGELK